MFSRINLYATKIVSGQNSKNNASIFRPFLVEMMRIFAHFALRDFDFVHRAPHIADIG